MAPTPRAELEKWAAAADKITSMEAKVDSGHLPGCFQGLWHCVTQVNKMGPHGGHEGVCLKLKLAKLDEDGSGQLSEKELQQQEAQVTGMLEAAKEFLLSSGVVAALVLSILYPILFEEQDVHKDIEDNLSEDALNVVMQVHNGMVIIGICLACCVVFLTVRNYMQLIFWMPTVSDQVLFVQTASGQYTVASLMMLLMWMMFACLISGSTLARGPITGLLALVMSVIATTFFYRYEVRTTAWAEALLRKRTRELISKT